jgi:hypothetical protein
MILYTAEEVAEFIEALSEVETYTRDKLASALDDHRDHMIAGGHEFGREVSDDDEPHDDFLPSRPGERYGGGSI